MAEFRYKAVAADGQLIEGRLEALDQAAAIAWLRRHGHMPLRADEAGARHRLGWLFRDIGWRSGLTARDIILLTGELATLLKAGLPLDRALSIAARLTAKGPRRRLLEAVIEAVRGGASLADGLARCGDCWPPFYVGMIRAGETMGTLEAVLGRLADMLERTQEVRDSVRSALAYPIMVLIVTLGVLLLLLTAVIPQFEPLFRDAGHATPTAMAILLAIGGFLSGRWWVLVIFAVGLVLGIRYDRRRPEGALRWGRWILRTPLLGTLVTKIETARYCRSLGLQLGGGTSTLPALSLAAGAIGNPAMAAAVGGILEPVKRGEGLAASLVETGLMPPLAIQLIQVGEESGQLEPMLLRIADIFDGEVKHSLQRHLSLLAPLITVGLGMVIATIVASMLSAIMSIYDLPL